MNRWAMNTYLVIYEAGKNNIAGNQLHIVRGSDIVSAFSEREAIVNSKTGKSNSTGLPFQLNIFGHEPDYLTIIDIKFLCTDNE